MKAHSTAAAVTLLPRHKRTVTANAWGASSTPRYWRSSMRPTRRGTLSPEASTERHAATSSAGYELDARIYLRWRLYATGLLKGRSIPKKSAVYWFRSRSARRPAKPLRLAPRMAGSTNDANSRENQADEP